MQNFPKAERAERTQPRAGIRPIGYAGYFPRIYDAIPIVSTFHQDPPSAHCVP